MKQKCNSCDGIYNTSLDVRFTKSCPNNCEFCIEHAGIGALPKASVEEMIASTIASQKSTVLILGGEPCEDLERLFAYVKGIYSYVDKVYITTSIPRTMEEIPQILQDIMEWTNGINVSVHSGDWRENNRIFRNLKDMEFNRLNVLKQLNQLFPEKVRVNLNLIRGGLDTKEKIDRTLNLLFDTYLCRNIKIQELQHAPDLYVSYEKVMRLSLPSPYAHGCQTKVVWQEGYPEITLKRSCFFVERSLEASWADLLKFGTRLLRPQRSSCTVLYENAELSQGWKMGA